MAWGASAEKIAAAAGAAADELPFMRDRVEPAEHLLFEWTAFFDLSTDRQIGFGVGPIPWTAVDRYAERSGLDDGDEIDRFHRLIRAMDGAFFEHIETKAKKAKP